VISFLFNWRGFLLKRLYNVDYQMAFSLVVGVFKSDSRYTAAG
jgi:hypothetical protein